MGAFFGAFATSKGGSSGGGFAGAAISANVSAGSHDNFDPGGVPAWPGTLTAPYGRLFLTLAGAATLTGLKAGLDGQQVQLIVSGGDLTLANLSGSSLAANQFQIGFPSTTVPDGTAINMIYTAGAVNKWVVTL